MSVLIVLHIIQINLYPVIALVSFPDYHHTFTGSRIYTTHLYSLVLKGEASYLITVSDDESELEYRVT